MCLQLKILEGVVALKALVKAEVTSDFKQPCLFALLHRRAGKHVNFNAISEQMIMGLFDYLNFYLILIMYRGRPTRLSSRTNSGLHTVNGACCINDFNNTLYGVFI